MADVDFSALYSTTDTVRKTISACGLEFDVFVRKLPAVDLRRFHLETQSVDREEAACAGFKALQKALRTEDGGQMFNADQLKKMKAEALSALMKAFTEVNTAKADDELEKL